VVLVKTGKISFAEKVGAPGQQTWFLMACWQLALSASCVLDKKSLTMLTIIIIIIIIIHLIY